MKKSVKISLIVIGTLFLLVVIVALLISPLSKRYIEKNGKELIGRTVTMDKLRFNMFTGSLRIVDFDMKEQNDAESFFRFDTLDVKVKLFDFLFHKVTVKKIHLSDARLHIWQRGSEFNFDDLSKKFGSSDSVAPAPPEKESKPWEIGIYDIMLRNGNILYKDLSVGSNWDMEDLNLKIPGVYFSGKETDVGFDLLFTDGGRLKSQLKYDIEKSTYHIMLELEKFSIAGLLPYLQQTMRVGSLSGLLDAKIGITGDMEHIMNSAVHGKAELGSFDLRDDREHLVVSADKLAVDMAEVRLEESKYILNEFSAQGVSTTYVMEKDSSSNFTYLMKESSVPVDTTSAKTKASTEPPLRLVIGKVDMKDINIEFKDNTLQMPFTYELKDIGITANDFDPDKTNDIIIRGKTGTTGMADIRWTGNFNDLSNLNLVINLSSVEIKDFTPYSMDYFAYPLTEGILTFSAQNTIKNNMLTGTNGLDIFKCAVDKADKSVKPKMKVPLRLAVYVLKDRNDKIKLDLPVTGDIRSPEFSYKKIILKALVNVLVKVSLSPLDFLAGSLGFNPEQLEAIEFTNLQEDFTSDQYDKFNQLSDIMTAKPDLMLDIKQDINYTQAVKDQSLIDLKRDYYMKKISKKNTDMLDMSEIAKIKDNDPELTKFADGLLGKEFQGDIYAKSMALYKDSVNNQIGRTAEKRNKLLTDYLVTRRQIPATSIKVETVPLTAGKAYEGKSVFRTSLSLPGEEALSEESADVASDSVK